MERLVLLACVLAVCQGVAVDPVTNRQRAEVIDGRVELEYRAKITAVRKIIHETEFVTRTQTIIDSPYCVSYDKDLELCTPSDVQPTKTQRRLPKSLAPEESSAALSVPILEPSILEGEDAHVEEIELVGIREECLQQNEGVTYLTTVLETQTVTVTKTRPGAKTVTISIGGCLPSPMPFNAPTC